LFEQYNPASKSSLQPAFFLNIISQ